MPTQVRYHIVGATTLIAIVLYLDRICIAEIAKLTEFKDSLGLDEEAVGSIISAFFFAYALAQVPAGWLSDRLGARSMLSLYVCIWSICTILTGLANGFFMLFMVRLVFGISQAGCYPTASSLIKRWIPISRRGTASSLVSFGGRVGGAVAPLLTAWLLKDYLSWRWVLVLYGCSGFLVAVYFWIIFRETPNEHPWANDAERDLIAKDNNHSELVNEKTPFPPLFPLMQSGSMWLMCAMQFGINIGWVFLATWLPTYLKEVKHVDPKTGGLMSTIVLTTGIVGMLCGGPLTDFAVAKLGRRWGRSLPPFVFFVVAIAAYQVGMRLESAWAFIAAMSLVAFATDVSVPAVWAFMQDVGGKNTAAVFGWGNMWGNLGAALMAKLIPTVVKQWDANKDWHEVFLLFSAGYLVAALAALGINANKTIE